MSAQQTPHRVIDLRSDLLARPTPEMCEHMLEALRDRAHFELREDPRQRAVERTIAGLLGTEDALLFPTCTMANQTALALLTRQGEAVLTQPGAHVITSESGAAAAIAGVQIADVGDDPVSPDPAAWRAAIEQSRGVQQPRITAISLENTHTRSGGRILSVAALRPLIDLAHALGLASHLDGARLVNAAVELDVSLRELAAGFDTVSLSLNKSIGAPLGAALAGSTRRIEAALAIRHRLGGGMRRMGLIAAAAAPALTDFSLVRDDHRRARVLAQGLARLRGVTSGPVESNLVVVAIDRPGSSAAAIAEALARRGVLVLPYGTGRLRLATYRGVTDDDIDVVIGAFDSVMKDLDCHGRT